MLTLLIMEYGLEACSIRVQNVLLLMEENFTLHLFLPEYSGPLSSAGVGGADPLQS